MKILLINKYYYIKGGADSVFFNTIKLLENHSHQVVPFCTKHPNNLSSQYDDYFVNAPEIRNLNGVWKKIKSIPRFFMNKNAASQLDKLLKQERPDIAHIHNLFNGISLSILPVLKKYHIPIVITMHDTRFICPSSYFDLRGNWCKKCPKTLFLNCAFHRCYQDDYINSVMCAMEMFHKEYIFNYNAYISQYIFLSENFKKMHTLRHSYFEDKGVVLYNFLPDFEQNRSYDKGNYLFYYGRITAEKGISTLVEVMKNLPHIQLKIAGIGPLLNILKQTAPKNVCFLGFISGKELYNQIEKASFIVVPSECAENNPLTIIESYTYGKPVIGSKIGGIPEIIDDGKTGFIFEAFDKKDLERIINVALSLSKEEYKKISINAKEFANKHFNSETHYQTLMNIYNKAISNYENI
ncbi:glycosyltransferase [Bacteroides nordii]|uniref:glycosyltransferase n=1 Tax=Bacteroides nordii TaxID=291645 RepID=UPI00243141A2|nr:glycosyltransferase [Bacteroides nordii]